MELTEQFDNYEITNGMFRQMKAGQLQTAEKLGCTGTITVEAETKKVTKKCEGKTAKEKTIVEKLNCTFKGHMPVGVLRKVYGLTDADLKTGVIGYSRSSVGASGALTFDEYDLGRENHKLVAFPNITFTDGLKFTIENGKEEIAEIEVAFSALFDANGYCYYEALAGQADLEEAIKNGWNSSFAPELVKKPQ